MDSLTPPPTAVPVWRAVPPPAARAGDSAADGPAARRYLADVGPVDPSPEFNGRAADGAADTGPAERNHLLRLLAAESPAAYAEFVGAAERVPLAHKAVLYAPHAPIPYAYFPESAVCSILMPMADGAQVEVGTVGHEGMVGLALFLGGTSSPTLCVAQLPGEALRVPADAFRAAAAPGTPLHGIMQRFGHYLFDQAAQTAACNCLHPLEGRCARWLCMTHDRVGDARFPLTQEFLARMLGVRRAGVTVAAGRLQDVGLIRYHRGGVRVLDRAGLEALACECYRADRADYARLLGPTVA